MSGVGDAAYIAARAAFGREKVSFLDVDVDACLNSYGVPPCTAGRTRTQKTAGGSSTTCVLDSGASGSDDAYNGQTLWITPKVNGDTVASGGASTVGLGASANGTDDIYNQMWILIVETGEIRKIEDYDGTTKVATIVGAWTTVPTGANTYRLFDMASTQERRITDYVGASKTATVESAWASNPGSDTHIFIVINRPSACYRTRATCQDLGNYSRAVITHRFAPRGTAHRLLRGPAPQIRPLNTPRLGQSCLFFDGTDDYVQVSDSASFNNSGAFTLEGWIWLSSIRNGTRVLIATNTGGSVLWQLGVSVARKVEFAVRDSAGTPATALSSTTLLTETWYHVAGVFSANTLQIYINGVADGSPVSTAFGGNFNPASDFSIGRSPIGGSHIHAYVDDLRVWTVARTAAEILENKDRELLGTETGLAAYWKLNEGTGSTAQDATANNNDGTLSGPVWVDLNEIAARPYIEKIDLAPTEIDVEGGTGKRSNVKVTLSDDVCSDIGLDPYARDRLAAASGTFWGRFLARNRYLSGRSARIAHGFGLSAWDWNAFVFERYVLENFPQFTGRGSVTLQLKDFIRLADLRKVPAPTTGTLASAMVAIHHEGKTAASASTTITLAADASATDDAYNGAWVYITAGSGQGQFREITDYVGSTKVATVGSAWTSNPAVGSNYRVVPKKLTVSSGTGSEYGSSGYVRVGNEVVYFGSRSTDDLNLSAPTDRAQFGTTAADHAAGDAVQLCKVFSAAAVDDVVLSILSDAGLDEEQVDKSLLEAEVSLWFYDAAWNLTRCIAEPTSAEELLKDLCQSLGAFLWYEPQEGKIKFKVLGPQAPDPASPTLTDEEHFLEDSLEVLPQESRRITRLLFSYGLKSATSGGRDAGDFARQVIAVDTDAESGDEYADVRTRELKSKWLGTSNDGVAAVMAARFLSWFRDTPRRLKAALDYKDHSILVGDLAYVETRLLPDETGAASATRALLVRQELEDGRVKVELDELAFDRRYWFIAPAGSGDYPDDAEYAHICDGVTLKMADGSEPYRII